MNRVQFAMISSVIVLACILIALNAEPRTPVMVFCAASNKAVLEAVRADYEAETGNAVEVMYGASQVLLSSLEVSQSGDLYIPADDSFLAIARSKGLVAESLSIATMQGVVAVRKGNPRQITEFSDLLQSSVRFVQANPEAAAIGKVTRTTLKKQGLWVALKRATLAQRVMVTEVANDVLVDAADAGIVYDAVLHTFPDLEAVKLPELQDTTSQIAVGLLSESTQPERALHFARYIAARDRGRKRYTEFGFRTTGGDEWRNAEN